MAAHKAVTVHEWWVVGARIPYHVVESPKSPANEVVGPFGSRSAARSYANTANTLTTVTPSPTRRKHRRSALIPDTSANRAACIHFAAEQNGQVSADTFNTWLLIHGNPVASKLIKNLAEWFVNHVANPQVAEGYAIQARLECQSIGIPYLTS